MDVGHFRYFRLSESLMTRYTFTLLTSVSRETEMFWGGKALNWPFLIDTCYGCTAKLGFFIMQHLPHHVSAVTHVALCYPSCVRLTQPSIKACLTLQINVASLHSEEKGSNVKVVDVWRSPDGCSQVTFCINIFMSDLIMRSSCSNVYLIVKQAVRLSFWFLWFFFFCLSCSGTCLDVLVAS